MFQSTADYHTQAVRIYRLRNVVVCPKLHSLNSGPNRAERRNQHDYGVRVLRADVLQQVDPRDSRHTKVGNH